MISLIHKRYRFAEPAEQCNTAKRDDQNYEHSPENTSAYNLIENA